jgi:hypothetical protein
VALPLFVPHAGTEEALTDKALGWVMLIVVEALHPFTSVTVTVYVAAERPVAIAFVWAGDTLFQAYV